MDLLEKNTARPDAAGGVSVEVRASLVRRAPDQIACDMGGEVVVLDLKSGTYYGLDAVGARIWTLLEQPMPARAIRDAIMAEYDVDAATCERDVSIFLKQMQEAGLIHVGAEPETR